MRPFLEIDGEQTVELDYSALHIRMCYAALGLEYKGDPYAVEVRGWEDPISRRKAVKSASLIAINAKNWHAACHGINKQWNKKKIAVPPNLRPCDVLAAFNRLHPSLSPFMYSDQGVRLQAKDAEVAAQVFRRFIQEGAPIIGLHDGFVVRLSDKELLWRSMHDSYRHVVKADPVIKVEREGQPGGAAETEGRNRPQCGPVALCE